MDLKTAIALVDKDNFDLTGDYEDRAEVVAKARKGVDAAELVEMLRSGEIPEVVDAYRAVIRATDEEILTALAELAHW